MSLIEVKTGDVIKKQFAFKWRSHPGVFTSLVTIQVMGILFSLMGTGAQFMGGEFFEVRSQIFSGDLIISFTIFWGFLTALLLTTRAYREDDFPFVSTRLTSHLSTVGFLLVVCGIAGLTAVLSENVLRAAVYTFVVQDGQLLPAHEMEASLFGAGMAAVILMVFLAAGAGYLFGVFLQWNRLFLLIIPVLMFGISYLMQRSGEDGLANYLFEVLFDEANIVLFAVKALLVSITCFVGSFWIAGRLEVKRS
ncbi:hypothetical protein QRD89_03750 [Halobacillus sp. ACCC02827]|uniref:hypothetical protein n=1 Tax=unclassified Halobacillus TaxID=2636472 RepID=UPI000783C0AE|nr:MULTISPECIES: hypothetical protein [unclassified Halobacillus]WJE16483.1 hypothetical protein QRD89_03750 [Halobacillus sp. ACCC02827]